MMCRVAFLMAVVVVGVGAIDLPLGLRPAKAVGEPEKPIIPGVNEPQAAFQIDSAANVRTPPNLSLRSRMIAALNSPVPEGRLEEADRRRHPTSDEVAAAAAKAPLVFNKGFKKQTTPKPSQRPLPRATQAPPAGKNYGVNTIVQTNLVDSKGRVMKGVNVVPIRVASVVAGKNSRASASRVEAEDDKVVPIEFGSANSRSSLI